MFAKLILILIKGPLVIICILGFFIIGIFNKIVFLPFPKFRKFLAQRNTQWACWICRHIIGYYGNYDLKTIPKGHILICNHMSYMDILVIASKIPTLFVTSLEMKNTPFLGWITQIGECLYVNRRSYKNLNEEISVIQDWLNKGFNVLIFPEATTSNGVNLKPFKSSLLQVAQNGKVAITSYCLKYTKLNSNSVKPEDLTNNISWFENKDFLPHVLKQLSNRSVSFELKELDSFYSDEHPDRKVLVHRLESKIKADYKSSIPFSI